VIVAEEITSRFLNVIHLFNGHIPLIAIQVRAYELDGKVALVFTKVLDEMLLGLDEEDVGLQAITDRSYWETRGTKDTVALVDKMLQWVHEFEPQFNLKYNKFYIGLEKSGKPDNFVIFKPRKTSVNVEIRLEQTDEMDNCIDESGVDVLDYDKHYNRYRLKIIKSDLTKHKEFLLDLFRKAYKME
jgi:predicted transport protein